MAGIINSQNEWADTRNGKMGKFTRCARRGVRGSPTPPGKCVFPAECTRRTRTLPRVRSAVVLPTVGDLRRIRSLQPVQPAVLLLTAGHPRRTHSLLSVQPVVLFTCGGRVLFTLSALRAHTKARVRHVADT